MTTVQAITTGIHTRAIRRMLLAFAAVAVLATPLLVKAQGTGGIYLACRDEAWIDMGICYLNATNYLSKVRCNIAFELDLWGCNAGLVDALSPIF